MTADLVAQVDSDDPVLAPVTFILAGERLVTLRYHEPRAFRSFAQRAERLELGCSTGRRRCLSLLEVVIDRLADVLEKVGRDLEPALAADLPAAGGRRRRRPTTRPCCAASAGWGSWSRNVSDSLVTLERIFVFLGASAIVRPADKEGKLRLKTLGRDAHFLTEHAASLTQKLTFLLDATLGMISIEQNATIKIFSVAAVVFLPPTLIASIYGMNFEVMPELQLGVRLPVRDRADGAVGGAELLDLQDPRLALTYRGPRGGVAVPEQGLALSGGRRGWIAAQSFGIGVERGDEIAVGAGGEEGMLPRGEQVRTQVGDGSGLTTILLSGRRGLTDPDPAADRARDRHGGGEVGLQPSPGHRRLDLLHGRNDRGVG